MSAPLLLTWTIKCWRCNDHLPSSQFSKKDKRHHKNGKKTLCLECGKIDNRHKQISRYIRKKGLYECVVCGTEFEYKNDTDEFSLKRRYGNKCVCSASCLRFFDRAILYVKELHGVNHPNAMNIVVSTWFNRRLRQNEKDIRIQARNAQGNAAA